jgi:uncharacterized protein (TIGR02145 family)
MQIIKDYLFFSKVQETGVSIQESSIVYLDQILKNTYIYVKTLFFMKYQFLIIIFICSFKFSTAQKVTEKINIYNYTYKCSNCNKTYYERDKVNILEIKDPDVAKSVFYGGILGAALDQSEDQKKTFCNKSTNGKHDFVLSSKTSYPKLITVDKGEITRNKKIQEEKNNVGNVVEYDNSGDDFYEGRKRVAQSIMHWDYTEYTWGFINEQGVLVIPFKYSKVGDFKEGVCPVIEKNGNGKIGFIDINGKTIIDFAYDRVVSNYDGVIKVAKGDQIFEFKNEIYAKQKQIKAAEYQTQVDNRKKKENDDCQNLLEGFKNQIDNKREQRIKELKNSLNNTNSVYDFTKKGGFDAQSVTIGNQVWLKNNLSINFFRNGDKIRQVTTKEEWELACINKEPVFAFYDYGKSDNLNYGAYYNYYTIIDKRGLAPLGWHIPNYNETLELSNTVMNKPGISSFSARVLDNDSWKIAEEKFEQNEKNKKSEDKKILGRYLPTLSDKNLKEISSNINQSGLSIKLTGSIFKYNFNNFNKNGNWWISNSQWIGNIDFENIFIYSNENRVTFFNNTSSLLFAINYDGLCSSKLDEFFDYVGYGNGFPVRLVKD